MGPELEAVHRAESESLPLPERIRVVDTHTEGEPTRLVVEGWPSLHGETLEERREDLRRRWDRLRTGVVREPRGHDAIVGAVLTPPVSPGASAGVVFFNNVGTLGMCGHGLIGVVRALEFLGRLEPGALVVDTPVGPVAAELHENGEVTVRNRPPRCHALDIGVDVPGVGHLRGDVVYGGNWFFLTRVPAPELTFQGVPELLGVSGRIQEALWEQGVAGSDGDDVDHVWLDRDISGDGANCRSFVRCPGGAYDRSPCGTGTSAKMAALHARGRLQPGERWVQESITGTRFSAWLEEDEGVLIPCFRGRAWITGESRLYFDPADPLRTGFHF